MITRSDRNVRERERINGYTGLHSGELRKTGVTAGQQGVKERGEAEKRGKGECTPAIPQTYGGGYPVDILLDVFIYTQHSGEGEAEVALRCCKTEHYYPSSPLPRTLRRPRSRVEEDAMAKTKNPSNYGQGPLTPTLPPFNPRRDLFPDSWFSTFISRSNTAKRRESERTRKTHARTYTQRERERESFHPFYHIPPVAF